MRRQHSMLCGEATYFHRPTFLKAVLGYSNINSLIMNKLVKLLLLKNHMIMMMKKAPFQHAKIKNYCLQVREKIKETSSVLNFEGF